MRADFAQSSAVRGPMDCYHSLLLSLSGGPVRISSTIRVSDALYTSLAVKLVLRRLRSSFKRAALLIRFSDFENQTLKPSYTQHQSRIGRQILLQASAILCSSQAAGIKPPELLISVSSFHGSLRKSITQQRTRSLRANGPKKGTLFSD